MAAVQTCFISLAYGLLFFKAGVLADDASDAPNCGKDYSPASCQQYFNLHWSALGVICIQLVMMSLTFAVEVFQKERPIMMREIAGGYYGIVQYYVSKILLEVPLSLFYSFLSVLITYFLIEFHLPFFLMVLEATLLSLGTSSIMVCISAVASNQQDAYAMAPICTIPQILFSGVFYPLNLIPSFLSWLRWLCPMYYGIEMMSAAEFETVLAAAKHCEDNATGPSCPGLLLRSEFLKGQGVNTHGVWWHLCLLLLLTCAYRVLGLLLLKRRTRFAV